MSGIWKRSERPSELERELLASRPEPPAGLVHALADRARDDRRAGVPSFRVALAGALTAVMLVAVASLGGVGYAASQGGRVVEIAKKVVDPGGSNAPTVQVNTPSHDQYGCGFGDKNHVHTGPPGNHNGFPGKCPPNAGPKK